MLDFLTYLKDENYDAYFFLPGEKENQIHVEASLYKNPGEGLGSSALGHNYHVVLFREDEDRNVVDLDQFEGVLTCPLEYISGLLPSDWYGIIARKTTTSTDFLDRLVAKLQE
jgi:hypothetical protein